MIMASGQPSAFCDSAATWRRQRRLRSWLRHERVTVALALAEKLHHSAQRPEMARAGEWGREMNFSAMPRNPLSHSPDGALQPLRRRAQRDAAGQDLHLVRAAGAGSAAHCAADRRSCPFVSDSRRSCATDVGTVARHPPFLACSLKLILSRLSKRPRSCPWTSLCELRFASRSWWTSWLKCRRSYPSPRCSGLPSRSLTIQFRAGVCGSSLVAERQEWSCLVRSSPGPPSNAVA